MRALAASGASFFVANSFSKSMSVYGERCGALTEREAPAGGDVPTQIAGATQDVAAAGAVADLGDGAERQRIEERSIETGEFRTEADDSDDLVIRELRQGIHASIAS